MPKIELYYDEVYVGPECLIAWNEPESEDTSLTDWWDDCADDWNFPPAGDHEFQPRRFTPKALTGETLTHWWDGIGALWHKVAHQYPLA